MIRKLSKIVVCGSIAIFCTLFANPNQVQTINAQNAQSIVSIDNIRTQNVSDTILSIQERSAIDVLIDDIVTSFKTATDSIAGNLCITSYAATSGFSQYWYANADGSWSIRDGSGTQIVNSWVCDDLATGSVDTGWYLINEMGRMTEGLIFDGTNYYLLNPEHNGMYGSLVLTDGYNYMGRTLYFDHNHQGCYGRVTNPEALSGLSYTTVNLAGKASLYTSAFSNVYGGGSSGNSGSGYDANTSVGNSGSGQQLDSEGFVTNIGLDDELMNGTPCGISSEDMSWMLEMASKTTFS